MDSWNISVQIISVTSAIWKGILKTARNNWTVVFNKRKHLKTASELCNNLQRQFLRNVAATFRGTSQVGEFQKLAMPSVTTSLRFPWHIKVRFQHLFQRVFNTLLNQMFCAFEQVVQHCWKHKKMLKACWKRVESRLNRFKFSFNIDSTFPLSSRVVIQL